MKEQSAHRIDTNDTCSGGGAKIDERNTIISRNFFNLQSSEWTACTT
jgi:hypothetical protein